MLSQLDTLSIKHLVTLTLKNHLAIDSRERNRVHARNTRERKKSQMDGLQSRIQELVDEVSRKDVNPK